MHCSFVLNYAAIFEAGKWKDAMDSEDAELAHREPADLAQGLISFQSFVSTSGADSAAVIILKGGGQA